MKKLPFVLVMIVAESACGTPCPAGKSPSERLSMPSTGTAVAPCAAPPPSLIASFEPVDAAGASEALRDFCTRSIEDLDMSFWPPTLSQASMARTALERALTRQVWDDGNPIEFTDPQFVVRVVGVAAGSGENLMIVAGYSASGVRQWELEVGDRLELLSGSRLGSGCTSGAGEVVGVYDITAGRFRSLSFGSERTCCLDAGVCDEELLCTCRSFDSVVADLDPPRRPTVCQSKRDWDWMLPAFM